jgi:hypothetical protein
VNFTLTFYKDVAAAKAVAAERSEDTALVENGVVDFEVTSRIPGARGSQGRAHRDPEPSTREQG